MPYEAPVIPVGNVTLTKIAGGGSSEDYDAPEGADPERWSGSEPAYLNEEVLTDLAGGELNQVSRSQLTYPRSLPVAHRDDVLTYTQDGNSVTRRVQGVEDWSTIGSVRVSFFNE